MKVLAIAVFLFLCFVLGVLVQGLFERYDERSWISLFALGALFVLVVVSLSGLVAVML